MSPFFLLRNNFAEHLQLRFGFWIHLLYITKANFNWNLYMKITFETRPWPASVCSQCLHRETFFHFLDNLTVDSCGIMLDLVFHQVVSYLSVCVPGGTMRNVSIEGQSDNKLKELFYTSSIPIQGPSCCLALFVWKIWHLVRNSSISWPLCLLIHLWSCESLGRSLTLHFSLNLYIKLRGGTSAPRLIYLSHDQIVVNFFVSTFIQYYIYWRLSPFLVNLVMDPSGTMSDLVLRWRCFFSLRDHIAWREQSKEQPL